jgi:ABC-2 type transport system ATP-binding protein
MNKTTRYAISVEGLCHSYGKTMAINNISFNVEEGQIFSFLGPKVQGNYHYQCVDNSLPVQKGR